MSMSHRAIYWIDKLCRPSTYRFGKYEKVYPVHTTPSRIVPAHIAIPEYAHSGTPKNLNLDVIYKTSTDIDKMRQSCTLAANILHEVGGIIKPGVTTDSIDEFVHNKCIEARAYPSPLNYKGFPKSVCTSVNNVAVHGIPDLRRLLNGDIINVDITVYYNGFHGDCSNTFLVGDVDDKGKELVALTNEVLHLAIKKCGPGVPFCAIGSVIERFLKKHKRFTSLPAFVGHGIGSYFHEPPSIYHTYNRYPGHMQPGMTFTIEPVLSNGSREVVILEDNWTVITGDGARTAQVEHTVLVTNDGVEILTIPTVKCS